MKSSRCISGMAVLSRAAERWLTWRSSAPESTSAFHHYEGSRLYDDIQRCQDLMASVQPDARESDLKRDISLFLTVSIPCCPLISLSGLPSCMSGELQGCVKII